MKQFSLPPHLQSSLPTCTEFVIIATFLPLRITSLSPTYSLRFSAAVVRFSQGPGDQVLLQRGRSRVHIAPSQHKGCPNRIRLMKCSSLSSDKGCGLWVSAITDAFPELLDSLTFPHYCSNCSLNSGVTSVGCVVCGSQIH